MRELSDLRGLREGRLQGGMKNGIPGPRDKGPGIFFSNATAMGSYRTHAMNISRGIARMILSNPIPSRERYERAIEK